MMQIFFENTVELLVLIVGLGMVPLRTYSDLSPRSRRGTYHCRRPCPAPTLSSSNSSSLTAIVLANTIRQVIFFEQNVSYPFLLILHLVELVGKKKSKARDNDDSLRLVAAIVVFSIFPWPKLDWFMWLVLGDPLLKLIAVDWFKNLDLRSFAPSLTTLVIAVGDEILNFTRVRRDVDKSESGGSPGIRSVNKESSNGIGGEAISFGEAKRLMRLVNVEALEMKLGTDRKKVIRHS
ncbi:calcium uniporter protein 6 [Cucumis melo var. makuwa]|uniref:Calcium uniporter protein 6 n=1 Tax=Cucumis melo var. makuwa TaxID=1194695 RepID=A0A5A7TQ45_CUCMM|nr:calcium uniporter protein 6 [Cucumis melo var. makuwa]